MVTGMTLDQLKHLTDMLSPADKARLIDDLIARLATEIASTKAQESPLRQRLRSINLKRVRAIMSSLKPGPRAGRNPS
ncbi:MAG: addiction module protein [Roseiflexus sp.]|jgi:hypothetical protein|nr:addiction module protein [Roseiflexus sp.]MBO9346079.1 addiction module protein [Chloroflexota bacterium]MBO9384678.1 addiction module protein [Roseiflexus sp.]MBO9390762.1 addiction module protein [Roseiflexus sp.]